MQINSCLVVNHVSLGFNNVKLCYDSYKNNNKKEWNQQLRAILVQLPVNHV